MSVSEAVGVDWAGGQWFCVKFRDGTYAECALESTFEAVWTQCGTADRIVVDIPIGLPSESTTLKQREKLDARARSVTGFPSSVFPAPSRAAVSKAAAGESYEVVSSANRAEIGKGLSRQSYQLAAAAGQVDTVLQNNEEARTSVAEAHPEVCFRGLLGRQLRHRKTAAAGVGERLDALGVALEHPEATLRNVTTDLPEDSEGVAVDDVLDALVLAVVAAADEIQYLPHEPAVDTTGIPMRMAYTAEDSLNYEEGLSDAE
jgi:predicted RNase H-like nuclease